MARKPRGWTGARTPSALKRVRTAERRAEVNQPRRSAAKTLVAKALEVATGGQPVTRIAALRDALSALDRAAKAGAIHANAAARRKSRLTRKVNAALGGEHVQTAAKLTKTTGKAAAAKAAKTRIALAKAGQGQGRPDGRRQGPRRAEQDGPRRGRRRHGRRRGQRRDQAEAAPAKAASQGAREEGPTKAAPAKTATAKAAAKPAAPRHRPRRPPRPTEKAATKAAGPTGQGPASRTPRSDRGARPSTEARRGHESRLGGRSTRLRRSRASGGRVTA